MEVLIFAVVAALLAALVVLRSVRIVPQARARNVERLGRYQRTLTPGLNVVVPFVDRVYPAIDLREQVVTFAPRPVRRWQLPSNPWMPMPCSPCSHRMGC